MRRLITIGILVLMLLLLAGLGLVYLNQSRAAANRAGCRNNLRMLAMMGTPFVNVDGQVMVAKDAKLPASVWPGTIANAALAPEERLSWVVLALPTLSEPNLGDDWKRIDRDVKWDAPANRKVAEAVLRTMISPGHVPPLTAGEPAPAMYVGIAGLGNDAATLSLTEPLSPRAGAFRYDAVTPFEVIIRHDGVSQSFLFGQTISDLGPWIRGGSSTVRGFEESRPILARSGGQFGGALSEGSFFAFVDGSVRLFRYETDVNILKALATIAGGPAAMKEE